MTIPRFDRLDVTPFIDVLLVLLILFMVVVPVPERPLDGSLPGTGGPATDPPHRIRIDEDGLWLDGRPLSGIPALSRELRHGLGGQGPGVVLIESSDAIRYEQVVAVIDGVRGAGISRIGLLDQTPEARSVGSSSSP